MPFPSSIALSYLNVALLTLTFYLGEVWFNLFFDELLHLSYIVSNLQQSELWRIVTIHLLWYAKIVAPKAMKIHGYLTDTIPSASLTCI